MGVFGMILGRGEVGYISANVNALWQVLAVALDVARQVQSAVPLIQVQVQVLVLVLVLVVPLNPPSLSILFESSLSLFTFRARRLAT